MKQYFAGWRQIKAEYGVKAILDAFLGAFLLSTLVIAPIYFILIEVLIVYFVKVYTLAVLLIVATLFYNILLHRLAKQSLFLKKPNCLAPVGKVLFWQSVGGSVLLMILGLIVLFVLIPIWMV